MSFYCPNPVVLMNGIPCDTNDLTDELIVNVPSVNFKVNSIDCQTLLPSSNNVYDGFQNNRFRDQTPERVSLLVMVSGDFSYSMDSTVITRGFCESFLLTYDGHEKCAILVQVFRFVAWLFQIKTQVTGSLWIQENASMSTSVSHSQRHTLKSTYRELKANFVFRDALSTDMGYSRSIMFNSMIDVHRSLNQERA